jgi:hypothetical protein
MPRGYYKRNQRNKTKTEPIKGVIEEAQDAFIKEDRNKMSISELRRLILILEERTKRDR